MNRINVLDEAVASRIAAGEVVVNPAAVVKELLENSIDAGAGAVTVEIEEGGKRLIRVTDNGSGIQEEDVPLAVMKHATSKISMVSDLSNVSTMGFRGEALSSMAAVARLTISTRAENQTAGTILQVNGGGEPTLSAAGLPEGTTVKVENLFYNVPARQKFMKNTAQETVQVGNAVLRAIIGNPYVAIKYINNGKLVYQSPGNGLKNALITVYGKDIVDKVMDVAYINNHIEVSGYISKPSVLYKNANHMLFFLNGRYIQSKLLRDALMHGYGERILRSHFPFAVLNIKMPYEMADVNVHPGKLQVLFYDENTIDMVVNNAVIGALQLNATPRIEPRQSREAMPLAKEPTVETPLHMPRLNTADRLYRKPAASLGDSSANVMNLTADRGFERVMDSIIKEAEAGDGAQGEIGDVRALVEYNIIGQAFQTYLICESGGTLYFIDQHAAHERINYERMKQELERGGVVAQQLLIPAVKKFSQQDFRTLQDSVGLLEELGFELEEFGPLTYKFSALPVQAVDTGTDKLIDEVLYELRTTSGQVVLARDKVIRAACRSSIKAGDRLSDEEISGLIHEIMEMEAIPTCPHGRPIAVAFTREDLHKGFKRTI